MKGLSGSPVISRDTGKVIGIVSTKLVGISQQLDLERREIDASAKQGSAKIMGVNANQTLGELIKTLDQQLANGLGSAVGIDSPKFAVRRLLRLP